MAMKNFEGVIYIIYIIYSIHFFDLLKVVGKKAKLWFNADSQWKEVKKTP